MEAEKKIASQLNREEEVPDGWVAKRMFVNLPYQHRSIRYIYFCRACSLLK
jgi:hypothetical protein